jgi:hypothetical protein
MFFIVGISCLSNANENILGQGNLSGSSTVTIWSDASISQEVLVVVNLISGSGDLHVYETNPSSLSYTLRANGAGIFLGIARQIQFAGTSYSTVGSYKVYGPPFPASVQGNLLSGDYYGKVGILSNSTSEFLFKVDPSAIGGQVLVYEDNHSSYNYSMDADGTAMFLGKAKRIEYIAYTHLLQLQK